MPDWVDTLSDPEPITALHQQFSVLGSLERHVPGKRSLLIEIKTGTSAADIHAGTGQLHLYPALIPAIAGHERILLLPERPHEDVVAALTKLEVAVFTYDPGIEHDGSGIRFTNDFLELCGLG